MPYVPNAEQVTEPTSSQEVASAALEFRTLKEYLEDNIPAANASIADHEARLDVIEGNSLQTRTVRAPSGESLTQLPVAVSRANRLLAFGAGGDAGVTPFTADQVSNAIAAAYAGGTTAAAVGYRLNSPDAVDTTVQEVLQRRRSIFDFLSDAQKADYLARTKLLDLGERIALALEEMYESGGGVLFFPAGIAAHSNELWLKQNVFMEGEGAGFANPYWWPDPEPRGSVLFKLPGSNTNGVKIMCDLTFSGGRQLDTGKTSFNEGARHCGGIRNMTLWGNRSNNPDPTVKDRNSVGHGIVAKAARNIVLRDLVVMFYAEDGLNLGDHDYGNGTAFGVNVSRFDCITFQQNGRDGVQGGIGDSRFTDLNIGYNGRNGITLSAGNTYISGHTWNNRLHGAFFGPNHSTDLSVATIFSYDNESCGIVVNGAPNSRVPSLISCACRGNGRNPTNYPNPVDRVNFRIGSDVEHWSILACTARAIDQEGVATATYNYYINNTVHKGHFEANASDGLASVQDVFIGDITKVKADLVTAPDANVPPTWTTVNSWAANTIGIGNVHLITLNPSAPATVSTLTYNGQGVPIVTFRNITTNAVTFTHNVSSLRLNSGANVVLGQHQSIRLQAVNNPATVWQQV